jgi:tetratricopeptide (TPR) repeat protein
VSKVVPAERKVEPSGVFKTLAEADQAYERKDYEGAKTVYLRVLRESSDRPVQAKAYYGLAKIATLQNDPDLAVRLFEKTLDTSPDDYVKGYTLLYLGRLADASGEREKARERYQAVLELQGAALAARKAAEKGLQQAFQK